MKKHVVGGANSRPNWELKIATMTAEILEMERKLHKRMCVRSARAGFLNWDFNAAAKSFRIQLGRRPLAEAAPADQAFVMGWGELEKLANAADDAMEEL